VNNSLVREHWHISADATRLFARDEGPVESSLAPLLCLPGLTRHSGDFEPVFTVFGPKRRVIAMDFRGRGRSAKAAASETYRPDVELQDSLGFLDQLGISRVAVLGTSRGGIVGMLMAAFAKPRLAGLMLNDVGCALNQDGLLSIKDHVVTMPRFQNWTDAALAFSRGSRGFSNVSAAQWQSVVRNIYFEADDGIGPQHDPRLADTLPSADDIRNGKVAELWSLLPTMQNIPFGLLRGSGSDLLSLTTVQRMQADAPNLVAHRIADRGHVPFLDEIDSVAAIEQWLADVDQKEKGR
jgi:pimeloyl-ACP methyl ester carboxylesterase